jgi:hypothetical protein
MSLVTPKGKIPLRSGGDTERNKAAALCSYRERNSANDNAERPGNDSATGAQAFAG